MKIEITYEQVERINEALSEEGTDSILSKKELQAFIDRLIANYLGDL
jgi:hypothetical protein